MQTQAMAGPDRSPLSLLLAAAMVAGALIASSPGFAAEGKAEWSPTSSERLIRLPATYLKKAVEQDFARSPLAAAMADSDNMLRLKRQTLEDLQGAIAKADGQTKIELQHQFLGEKRAYLELMATYQSQRRQRARTKVRLYESLLRKLGHDRRAMTPQKVALVEKQKAALARLDATSSRIDTRLFRSTIGNQSKYAAEYARNLAAIERLADAIKTHPMSTADEVDGTKMTREDHLHDLLNQSEAELATLDQEGTILGYMAKLVALDAMALSDAVVASNSMGEEPKAEDDGVTGAVDLFVTQ